MGEKDQADPANEQETPWATISWKDEILTIEFASLSRSFTSDQKAYELYF